MSRIKKAIQCRKCGKIILVEDIENFCPKCGESTGLRVTSKDGGPLSDYEYFFHGYRIFYNTGKMKPIIIKQYPFGIKKYLRDAEPGE